MRDIKLKNGDILTDSCGNPIVLEGVDARLQSAELISGIEKGSFVYNRELGADLSCGTADEGRLELAINEALAGYGDIYARVSTDTGEVKTEFIHREV